MAYLVRHCMMSLGTKRISLCEINRLKYIIGEGIRCRVAGDKKFIPVTQTRYFATENDVKVEKPKLETEQIYYGPLTKQIRSVKVFTLLSSIAGILAQPVLYTKIQELGVSAPAFALGTFYGFFVLVSPFFIHLVTKRYVTHVEYDPKAENYTAYTYTFFLQRRPIHFTPDDVKIPTIAGVFTSIMVKGNPLFLDPKMFNDLSHYSKIMGYDKPIDFSIDADSDNKKK